MLGVLLAGSIWLLAPALFTNKVLSAGDKVYFQPPFAAERPAGLERPSNFDLSDAVDVFHPHLLQAREALRAGELPAWNPHIEAGRPIGAQNGGPFYPLNFLAYLLPFWQSLELIALIKLLVAGTGMFVLLRRLELGRPGALLGSASFAFSVSFVVSLEHPQAVVYGLLPWLLASADWMVRGAGGTRAILACGGLIGAAQLAGHPESTFVLVSGFLAFLLWRGLSGGGADRKGRRRRLPLRTAAVAVVALVVSAVALVPTLLLLRDSLDPGRAAPPLGMRTLLAAFFPEAWGRPDKVALAGPEGTSYAYRAMYIGAVPLVLAAGGLAARRSGAQIFMAGTALVCGLLLLDLPVIPSVLAKLPLFSLVNTWHFIFLAVFCATALAGFGLDIALRGTPAERRRVAIVAALAAALPLVWLVAQPGVFGQWRSLAGNLPVLGDAVRSPDQARLAAGAHWALFAGLGVLLAVAAWRRPGRTLIGAAAVALVMIDLVPLGSGYHPAVSERLADPAPTRAIRFMQANADRARVAGFGGAFYPNAAERYGLKDARGEDLPERGRFGEIWTGFGGDIFQEFGLKVITKPGVARTDELLDLMAVRYVVDDGETPLRDRHLKATTVDEPGQRVLENTDALPRAWVAYGSRRAAGRDQGIARTLGSSLGDLERRPVIEADADVLPPGALRDKPGPAAIVRDTRGQITISAFAREPAVLVLSDSWDSGWQAKVDRKAADVMPANGAFLAVRLPPGQHTVEFTYRSTPLRLAALSTLIGLLCVVGGIGVLSVRAHSARRRR